MKAGRGVAFIFRNSVPSEANGEGEFKIGVVVSQRYSGNADREVGQVKIPPFAVQ